MLSTTIERHRARHTGCLAIAALLAAAAAHAQTPPSGWLENLADNAGSTLTPPDYTEFSYSFTAANADTTINFAFREVPAYFSFGDVSVSLDGTGPNLVQDPDFQGSTLGSVTPNGWGRWIQPIDVSAIGEIVSAADYGGCYGAANFPHAGSLFWCDGSVQGYDGLYQTIPTTVGDSYTISFWLADNSGRDWNDPDIDTVVYALNGINTIPTGTTSSCPNCGAPPPPPPPTGGGVPERRRTRAQPR